MPRGESATTRGERATTLRESGTDSAPTSLRPPTSRAEHSPFATMERETGFEPATPSLEGWRSTAELFPPLLCAPVSNIVVVRRSGMVVGRGGFEPPKAYASRFTVCPLWPLGYLPEPAGMR